jgi:hypothetical protein
VRNFSTEARLGREAHIGVTVRLLSPENRPLVEKRIDVKESGYTLNNFNADILEEPAESSLREVRPRRHLATLNPQTEDWTKVQQSSWRELDRIPP